MTNAQLQDVFKRYSRSDNTYLWDVYKSYSRAKERVYNNWYDKMCYLKGYHLRIVSHNSMIFTLGFMTEEPNTKGQIRTIFNYITPSHWNKSDVTEELQRMSERGIIL